MAGEERKARDILRQLEEKAKRAFVSPYHLAYVYTGLGEYDRAIDLLETAVAARTGATYGIKGRFSSCRSRSVRDSSDCCGRWDWDSGGVGRARCALASPAARGVRRNGP